MAFIIWIPLVILELIHAYRSDILKGCVYQIPNLPTSVVFLMIHNKLLIAFGDQSFKILSNQFSMVGYWPTMAVTGNRELGLDPGEGARETATTSKEGSRRADYPILTQGGRDRK